MACFSSCHSIRSGPYGTAVFFALNTGIMTTRVNICVLSCMLLFTHVPPQCPPTYSLSLLVYSKGKPCVSSDGCIKMCALRTASAETRTAQRRRGDVAVALFGKMWSVRPHPLGRFAQTTPPKFYLTHHLVIHDIRVADELSLSVMMLLEMLQMSSHVLLSLIRQASLH